MSKKKSRPISISYTFLKQEKLKESGGKCENCGCLSTKKNRLTRHHKIPFAKRPDLFEDPENIAILCENCHNIVHLRRKHNKIKYIKEKGLQGKYLNQGELETFKYFK